MPVFRIQHTTTYQYNKPVKESVNQIRVFAYGATEQEVLQHDLHITGSPQVLTFTDYWGNKTGVFNLMPPHKELVIDSRLVVRTLPQTPPDDTVNAGFSGLAGAVNADLKLLELSRPDLIDASSTVTQIIEAINDPHRTLAEVVQRCSQYIYREFKYIKGITTVETTLDEILESRAGVCQDFAHVMLQVLRLLGIPSRYVSGYICPNKNGLRGEGATHAWVDAWIPGHGWAGIDPTNNVWVTDKHVKLAVGRNFNDCSPVKGSFKGPAKQHLSVFVSVGYEDGHIVEELNDVQQKQKAEPAVAVPEGAFQQ